jgi:hypothetical protein
MRKKKKKKRRQKREGKGGGLLFGMHRGKIYYEPIAYDKKRKRKKKRERKKKILHLAQAEPPIGERHFRSRIMQEKKDQYFTFR